MRSKNRRLKRKKRTKKSVQFAKQTTVLGETRKKRECKKLPPDGGWSWMVLLGIFVMTTQSLFSVSGLLLGEPIRSWGHDVSAVASASTMIVAVQNFFGLSSGILIQKWHARTLGVVGTILVFSGLVLTSRATKLWMVFVTWGFMAGIGMSMVVPTAFVILTHYFTRYRRYAIGVAVAGTGVGQMLLPLVLHGLILEYQFSGACLITASISLQALPAYLLCRPIQPKPVPMSTPVRRDSSTGVALAEVGVGVGRRRQRKCNKCRILAKRCYYGSGFALLSDLVLANTIICSSLVYMTIIYFTAVLPLYLKDGGKVNSKLTAHFMTIMSGSDLAARVVLPIVQEKFKINARTVVMVGALLGSLFRSIMVEFPYRTVILMTLIMSGISRAAIVLNINLSLAEMVGPAHLMATIGVSMVCKALATLTAGTFIGWLHDLTKSYQVYLHSLTLVVLLTFISWLTELILIRRQHRRNTAGDVLREAPGDLEDSEAATITLTSNLDELTEGADVILKRTSSQSGISSTNRPRRKFIASTKNNRASRNLTLRNAPHAEIVQHKTTTRQGISNT